MRSLDDAIASLSSEIAKHERMVVAFSGGTDSALLAWMANRVLGAEAVSVTAVSASLPESERLAAASFAREHDLRHLQLHTDELDVAEYQRNDSQRCYFCKVSLFAVLEPLAALLGATIALGTNLDDLGEYRPGHRASRERDARTPLADALLSKSDVRAISGYLGLPTSAKPAAACLASRVAYGDPVTRELLARIERAEDALHELGFAECRVRAHSGGVLARIEVPKERLVEAMARRQDIAAAVLGSGFTYCTIDLEGLRSGSMNAVLDLALEPQRG